MFTSVIIPAGGTGERMGGGTSKQFLPLLGKPIIVHTLERFEGCAEIGEIVVAINPSGRQRLETLVRRYGFGKISRIVEGGKRRQDSVGNALKVVSKEAEIVLVHDAVRPFVRRSTIGEAINAARIHSAAVVAIPVKDTIKEGDRSSRIVRTLDRSVLWAAQTPQAFTAELLRKAYEKANQRGTEATDDSSLVEELDIHPVLVEGSSGNIKITTPDDLELAAILAREFRD
ncbi:MAG TPA: 2-C-methyl-D-erythritol 4-phosphate cytidylyltransferase [Bacteroidota bacterium]|nr:2-C-methyl-D-erythritol 4-phosphate cytidylyltransferase [Bacteroidota bacterium]